MVGERIPRENRQAAGEIRVLDIAAVLVRQWRIVVGAVGLAVGLAIIFSILQPKLYAARAVLLPVQEGGSNPNQFFSQLPPGLAALAMSNRSNQAQISAILKSASLADSMVHRLALELGTHGEAEIRHILAKQTSIKSGDGGSVIIEVLGKQPVLTAQIANEFAGVVNKIMAQLSSQTAMQRQAFLDSQLDVARGKLEESEQKFLEFQLVQEAPEIQEQARRTLEAAAQLQRQIMEQEVRVAQLRRTATPDNPELRAAIAELQGWRAQLRRLTDTQVVGGREVFVSLRESPELQLQATRILREFRKDEQVYVSLLTALAETQVEAKNDLPVVTVLDHAEVPKVPTGYPAPFLIGLGALLGMVAGVTGAFAREYLHGARADPENQRFFAAWDQLKADVRAFVPRHGRRQARLPIRG